MSRNPFEILSFELLELRVRGVGPFQEDLFILDLTDKDNEPSNFYIMAGRNGRGKTTSIEAIAYLLGLLQPEQSRLPVGWGTRLAEGAALQLDLRVRVSQDGAERAMLLSLCAGAGEDPFLYEWPAERLERYAIQRTARYGYGTRPSGAPVWFGEGDPLILDLKAKVQGAADREPDPSPEGLAEDAPTVLYFTAYRDLGPPPPLLQRTLSPPDWRYRTLWRFEREGERWAGTLDNALVWLEYLAP